MPAVRLPIVVDPTGMVVSPVGRHYHTQAQERTTVILSDLETCVHAKQGMPGAQPPEEHLPALHPSNER